MYGQTFDKFLRKLQGYSGLDLEYVFAQPGLGIASLVYGQRVWPVSLVLVAFRYMQEIYMALADHK